MQDEQPGHAFFPFQATDERESVNPATSADTCIGPLLGNEKPLLIQNRIPKGRSVYAILLPLPSRAHFDIADYSPSTIQLVKMLELFGIYLVW